MKESRGFVLLRSHEDVQSTCCWWIQYMQQPLIKKSQSGPKKRNNKKEKGRKPNVPRVFRDQPIVIASQYGRVRRGQPPRMRSIGATGDILVTHREYITDILGSTLYASNPFAVNPGLPGVFPWLSAIAGRFEKYLFESLCFEYSPGINVTSANGFAILACDFDASDPAPVNKTQVASYKSVVETLPSKEVKMVCQREDLQSYKSFKVRRGTLAANQDIKLYDTANFFICTVGQTDATMIGDVWVSYTVKLMTPQLNNPSIGDALGGLFSGTVNSAPFATNVSNLPVAVVSTGTTTSVSTWTFTQPWQGYVSFNVQGTTLASAGAVTGTASSAGLSALINTAVTQATSVYAINAGLGSTLIFTIGNATITSAFSAFGQADS